MKSICILLILVFGLHFSYAQTAANTWSVKFCDATIGRYPTSINQMTNKGWEYSNGIVLCGMEKVFEQVPTYTNYRNYIKAYVDTYVTGAGVLTSSQIMGNLGLDGCHPGLLCLFLYEQLGLAQYKTAAQKIRDTLIISSIGYPRTPEGGYWHRNNVASYKNVEYLDGIYMAQPFLAKYGYLFNDAAATDTAVDQLIILYNRLYSSTTHLVKHAFDYDLNTYAWAVPTTGISTEVWSRGMGWFVMSVVEVLKYTPHTHPKYATLVTMLNNLATGIKSHQDPTSKLWMDIVDSSASAAQNYVETSGSAMFIYSLKTAIDSGWISGATYLGMVDTAWIRYKLNYIVNYTGTAINGYSGGPQINSFCPALSVQNNYAAYVATRPVNLPANNGTGTQHPHGLAATLMAASAMEFPLNTLPVKFWSISASQTAGNINILWENYNDDQVDHFDIEKQDGTDHFIKIGSENSNGLGHYKFIDYSGLANSGTVLYRIKAVDRDGNIYYSEIITFKTRTNSQESVIVAPNPVTNGILHVTLNHLQPGTYNIKLANNGGQIFETEKMDYTGGQFEHVLVLPRNLGKGIYYLLINGQGNQVIKKISIE
jgi:unsaturated rhamnogalacturonyl hydrolase